MPQSFQDAVTISRELGVRYLWIDSLCIVQDDEEDWKREAAKMASIFHGAYLTIAAASAENSDGGCFLKIDPPPMREFSLPPLGSSRSQQKLYVRTSGTSEQPLSKALEEASIQSRGWIFQEMLLSRRVVHFTNRQLFWQCHAILESEDQVLYRESQEKPKFFFGVNIKEKATGLPNLPLPSFDAARKGAWDGLVWWSWVRDHSCRGLTFPSDSLPSLAGTVALYQRLTQDEPVVGLWRKDLPVHLSWMASEWQMRRARHSNPEEILDDQQPSWSWTSIKPPFRRGRGRFPRFSHMQFGLDNTNVIWRTEVEIVDVAWEGPPMVSRLQRAVLTIGRVLWPEPELEGLFAKLKNVEGGFKWREKYFDGATLGEEAILDSLAIHVLLWISCEIKDTFEGPKKCKFTTYDMLVIPDGKLKEPNVYKRVGISTTDWTCKYTERDEIKNTVISHLHNFGLVRVV